MYNKKSKASAILAIITAVLIIVLMILYPFLRPQVEEGGNLGEGIGIAFGILFFIVGCIVLYAGALPFTIVALVFGIKMLKQQSRNKLISYNRSLLIATCVLLPFIATGMILCGTLSTASTLGLFPAIYTVITAAAYLGGFIAQIVALVQLKKSPEETVSPITEQ